MQNLITIDTDNATIRFYVTRAREARMTAPAIEQMLTDLDTVALGLTRAHGTEYRVQSVL